MKFNQKWLWGMVVLLLILSLPGLASRWAAETSSPHYEIIMPYEEMLLVERDTSLSIDDILSTLKEAGLTTVTLNPISLEYLEENYLISIYNEQELANRLQFTAFEKAVDGSEKGYYITIPEAVEHRQFIEYVLPTEKSVVAEKTYYFIPKSELPFPLDTNVGYDELALKKIRELGLNITLKVENSKDEAVNRLMVRQLVNMKEDDITGLIGQGKEIIGFGHEQKSDWYRPLYDAGYYFYLIESNPLKGEQHFAKFANYDAVRLLSLDPVRQKNTVDFTVDQTTRAVKERNIRSIFYHIEDARATLPEFKSSFKNNRDAEENFEDAVSYLTKVQEKMPDRFTLGTPKLFDDVNVPAWVTALVLLAGMIFTYITSELVKNKYLRIGSVVVMALLAIAYFAFNRIVFLQAFALIISVITPIYAVIKCANGSQRIRHILVQYVKALAISMVGIWMIVGLLNGNGFLMGVEQFRGVKLVYIIPIAGIFLYVLSLFVQRQNSSGSFTSLLNKEVKYGHVIVLLIVAAIAYFYISRTGNAGSVSTFELVFRQWLEDLLYVRPRTKEFLIGFPFFVLALYVMGINRKWGSILLIPGVIGLLSIVNTFTHLHIPLEVSLLRTVYGAILGFVIGFVFIVIFILIVRTVKKYVPVK